MPHPACPSPAELTAYLDGRLPDHDHDSLTRHLDGCPECQSRLQSLAPPKDDTFKIRIGDLAVLGPFDEEPELGEVLANIGARQSSVEIGPEPSDGPPPLRVGNYELLEEIARGGMGVVYRARQLLLNRMVALKMIQAGRLASAQERQRFAVEAEAAAKLDHPNIVPVYEVGVEDGRHYLSMGLVEGQSLAERVAVSPLPPREAARVLRQVALAVAHAHALGVLHRDLKPANILLDAGGQPRITDFGLAKCLDAPRELTGAGVVMGTPSYMPPEQARGQSERIGPRSDVYALGATLYRVLGGRPPFQAATTLETLRQVAEQEPVSLRLLDPAIPRDIDIICLKCLEKQPERRYLSAQALADDLGRFLDGHPIHARPVSPLERGWRWCWRNPAVAALLAITTLAVAVLLAGGAYFTASLAERNERLREEIGRTEQAERQARDLAQKEAEARKQAEADKLAAQFQALRAENARHAIQIDLALDAWRHSNLPRARQVLAEAPTAFRDSWEQQHLVGLCRRKVQTLSGHVLPVRAVAVSPDGLAIASGGNDAAVILWDAATGEKWRTFEGHAGPVLAVTFSPDGTRIVSGSHDRTVKVWDVAGGKELRTLRGHTDAVHCVAISPDGRNIVSGGNDRTIKVWDSATGDEKRTLQGHNDAIWGVGVSPDGKWIVSGSADRTARTWDLETGQEKRKLEGHTSAVWGVAFSADGQGVVTGSHDRTVKVWDAATGQSKLTLRGHAEGVWSLAVSKDGLRIASGSNDRTVKVWDAGTGQNLLTLTDHSDTVLGVAFSPDRHRLLSAGDRTVKIWDLEMGQEQATLRGVRNTVLGLALHPDGKHLAGGNLDGTVTIWELATGRIKHTLAGDANAVCGVAFTPDGRRLISAGEDQTIKVWDAETGRETDTLRGHAGAVRGIVLTPDGRQIISASDDGTVKVWDVATRQEQQTLRGHAGPVLGVAVSPDGRRVVSAGADKTVKVWDAATGKALRTLGGHSGSVNRVVIRPDGRRITSAGDDGGVRVWDVETGENLLSLKGHTGPVHDVAISPDGQRIFSAGDDKTVRAWEAATGQEKLILRGHRDAVWSLAVSREGERVFSGSTDLTVRAWEALRSDTNARAKGAEPRE